MNILAEAEEGQKQAVENEKITEAAAPIPTTNESNYSYNVFFENLDFITRRKDAAFLFLDNVKIPEKNQRNKQYSSSAKKRKAHISDDEKKCHHKQLQKLKQRKIGLKVATKEPTVD